MAPVLAFLVMGSFAIITLGVVGWFLATTQTPERVSEPDPSD